MENDKVGRSSLDFKDNLTTGVSMLVILNLRK